MAHSLSAKKRVRQNAKRRLYTRSQKNALKSLVKRLTAVPDAKAAGKAGETAKPAETPKAGVKAGAKSAMNPLAAVQQKLDRMAAKGVLHPNTAARRKSRLAKKARAAAATAKVATPAS